MQGYGRQTSLHELKTKVTAVDEKKGESLVEVQFADTIFAPDAGGQPSDFGKIVKANAVSIDCKDVIQKGDLIVHRLAAPAQLEVGEEVTLVLDWERRYDHMQCHTGQHLVSACAKTLFNVDTCSWALTHAPSPCYIEMETAAISSEAIQKLTVACNDKIRNNLAVTVHYFPSVVEAEAERKKLPFADTVREFKAKPELLGKEYRIIKIADTDFNACCGTHLNSTGELQMIQFMGTEKIRGHTRLFFVAGMRAIAQFQRLLSYEADMSHLLNCASAEHTSLIHKLQDDGKKATKQLKLLTKEVIDHRAEKLIADAKTQASKFVMSHMEDSSPDTAMLLADAIAAALPAVPVFVSATENGETAFAFYGPDPCVKACLPAILAETGGKGGGKGGRIRGKIPAQHPFTDAVRDKIGQIIGSHL